MNKKKIVIYILASVAGIVFLCGLFFIAGLVGWLSADTRSGTGGNLSTGDKAILYNGSQEVPVAVNKKVLDEVVRMSNTNDTSGYAQLVSAGLVFHVDSGTEILILQNTVTTREIRIMQGAYTGESGWIPKEWARKK